MSIMHIKVTDLNDFLIAGNDLPIKSKITYKHTDEGGTTYSVVGQRDGIIYMLSLLVTDNVAIEEMDEVFQDSTADIGEVDKDQLVYVQSITFQ